RKAAPPPAPATSSPASCDAEAPLPRAANAAPASGHRARWRPLRSFRSLPVLARPVQCEFAQTRRIDRLGGELRDAGFSRAFLELGVHIGRERHDRRVSRGAWQAAYAARRL